MKHAGFKRMQFVFPIILIVIGVLWFMYNPGPVGGELHAPDFENGYSLYVIEEHSQFYSRDEGVRASPHNVWLVTDESAKDAIYELCGRFIGYRVFSPDRDAAAIIPSIYEHLPQICIVTDEYGYWISLINWVNYAEGNADNPAIADEIYGAPLFHVRRFNLALKPDDEDTLSFLSNNRDSNTTDREGRSDWYSTMQKASYDALLTLLSSVDGTVAEVYAAVE